MDFKRRIEAILRLFMNKPYTNHLGRKHQVVRMLWTVTWALCASWLPRSVGSGWKRFLLRMFGARVDSTAVVYSSERVYYPANLVMERYACLASDVDCYNVDPVLVGSVQGRGDVDGSRR